MQAKHQDMDRMIVKGYQEYPETNMIMVGNFGIKEMRYHSPQFDGDRHYLDIYYACGDVTREFQITKIIFGEDAKCERN